MSGPADLAARAAILAALRGDAALGALVNLVSDGEPVKASPPWLRVDDAVALGWGARGVQGVTLRQPIQLMLRGDQRDAVTAILDRIDMVLRAMPDEAGDWKITSLAFDRSQIARSRNEWRASVTYSIRLTRLV
jgi:hypothetical protein